MCSCVHSPQPTKGEPMLLTTKRIILGTVVSIALASTGLACGDNLEFVVPLNASANEMSPDASTADAEDNEGDSSTRVD